LSNSTYTIKELQTIENKVKIIKKIYLTHNIEYLSLDKFDTIDKINITNDEYYNVIKPIFRSSTDIPKNKDELKKMILKILKNLIANLNIIDSSRDTCKKNRNYHYHWNNNNITHYINLYKKYNHTNYNLNYKICFFKGV
jgi:hypothetical protein